MGNFHVKGKKCSKKGIDKSKFDIIIKQIYFTAQLNKDRRKGQQNFREKELLNLLREPVNRRNKDNEYHKASAIVNDLKWIKAQECVMRYADILKDNQLVIQMSKGDATKINDLIPYAESLIWGCQKGNVDCVKQFQDFIAVTFGPEVLAQLCTFTQVTSELKDCYNSILPSEKEIKLYVIELCQKSGISLETMNEIGHNLSLSDELSNSSGRPNSSPHNQGPANSGDVQNRYPPAGYFQGPQQMNYSHNSFSDYPPNNYPQAGFPSANYPNFSDGSFPQRNAQQVFPNYPQATEFAPSVSQSSSDEPYKHSPAFIVPSPSNINLNTNFECPSTNQGLPNSNGNTYPSFPRFSEGNAAAKIGGDPLDELDLRLKDIKKGL